jgi:hypothetical protein
MMQKFPRIAHCPWSENVSTDDKIHPDMSFFEGREVVATIKMDGENTNIARDYIHARSLEYPRHESRTWMKNFWSSIKHRIPENFIISGENMFAKHSLHYTHLKTFFYVFTIQNYKNGFKSWEETLYWCYLLNLTTVPSFYIGPYNRDKIQVAFDNYCQLSEDPVEGYVIRVSEEISNDDIDKFKSFCKWVRGDHVTTNDHWMSVLVISNELENMSGKILYSVA